MVFRKYTGLAAALVVVAGVSLPGTAKADVPLTRADVDGLLNRVELIPRGRSARAAQLSDYLGLGDALRTAAASRAELRFNDGSLARVGERATFRFTPNTRNFRLSNGTVLFLIPPGQGRTTIQTPNAVTGIQGSAVVVRHIAGQDLTLVMALTNNPAGPMTITTEDGGSTSALYAGQMALVRPGGIEVVEFDLAAFYQTSDLVEGLGLDSQSEVGSGDDPLAAVRAETQQALAEQAEFADGSSPVLNPAVVGVESSESSVASQPWLLSPVSSAADPVARNNLPPGLISSFPPAAGGDNRGDGGNSPSLPPSGPVVDPGNPGVPIPDPGDFPDKPSPDPGGSPGPSPNPTPDPGGSPGPSPNPTPDPGGSPGPSPNPTPDPGGSPGTSPNPTPDPGGSPGPNPNPTPDPSFPDKGISTLPPGQQIETPGRDGVANPGIGGGQAPGQTIVNPSQVVNDVTLGIEVNSQLGGAAIDPTLP